MKTYNAYRNFSMCKALLLAALMAVSVVLSSHGGLERHPVATAGEQLDHGRFDGVPGAIPDPVRVRAGGVICRTSGSAMHCDAVIWRASARHGTEEGKARWHRAGTPRREPAPL